MAGLGLRSFLSAAVLFAMAEGAGDAQVTTPTPRPGLAGDAAKAATKCERGINKAARTFVGTMDGTSISGTIHSSPSGPAVGRFSLRNVP